MRGRRSTSDLRRVKYINLNNIFTVASWIDGTGLQVSDWKSCSNLLRQKMIDILFKSHDNCKAATNTHVVGYLQRLCPPMKRNINTTMKYSKNFSIPTSPLAEDHAKASLSPPLPCPRGLHVLAASQWENAHRPQGGRVVGMFAGQHYGKMSR